MTDPGGVGWGRPIPPSAHECRRNMPLPNPLTFKNPYLRPHGIVVTAVKRTENYRNKEGKKIQKTSRSIWNKERGEMENHAVQKIGEEDAQRGRKNEIWFNIHLLRFSSNYFETWAKQFNSLLFSIFSEIIIIRILFLVCDSITIL